MPKQDMPDPEPFAGFQGPNYTQVPDALFDELLPTLSGAELKVLLYIIRRTFGFKRDSDAISISQMLKGIVKRDGTRLDHGAGVSKKTLLGALRQLEERNIVFIERRRSSSRGDEPSVYRLNVVAHAPRGVKTPPGGGAKFPQGGGVETPPGPRGKNSPTQETVEQETGLQETVINFESSKVRKVKSDKKGISEPRSDVPASGNGAEAKAKMESIGRVLERRNTRPDEGSARPEVMDEDYQKIQHYIGDRAREFTDTAPLKSSTTRAWNLFQKSGLSVDDFVSHIYQARSLTLEGTGRITKTVDDPNHRVKRKTKMAYFFAVLEDQLGFGKSGGSAGGGGKSTPPSPEDSDPYGIQR